MDKSLGTVLHFWGVFQFTQAQPLPSDHSTMLDLCIQNFFRVSTLYRVGRGRTARKFWKGCIVLRGNREITEIYEYCSTVPRTFVQIVGPQGWSMDRGSPCFVHVRLSMCIRDWSLFIGSGGLVQCKICHAWFLLTPPFTLTYFLLTPPSPLVLRHAWNKKYVFIKSPCPTDRHSI